MRETFVAGIGFDASQNQSGRRPQRRSLAERSAKPRDNGGEFAALKSGLDGTRQQFYPHAGRMPNAQADQTRRGRVLWGGAGDRQLTQLDLWVEREISRYLREQSSIYGGIIETWAAETIQAGFRLKPDTGNADLNIMLSENLFGWDGDGGWFNECDARGVLHFWDIMTLAEETEVQDGDHAFYLDPNGNNGRGSVAIIEGDRILTPYGMEMPDGYVISNGIVWNASGYPVKVFVADIAPRFSYCGIEDGRFYDLFRPWRAADGGVILSMCPKRATSTRRQPWLSTAVRAHDEIDDVFVAVRIQLRNAACRSTFTKIEDWEAYKDWLQIAAPDASTVAPQGGLTHSPNPGDHTITNPGESLMNLETNAPGDNFGEFINLQLTTLGLPLGMCIEEAVRIFQKSFSASRMAVDSTRRRYERRQRQIKRRKVVPILQFAVARLQAAGVLPDDPRCQRIRCGFPGWPYMEPLADAQASQVLVETQLRSRRTCATEIGDDYDNEIALIREEETLFPPQNQAPRTPIGAVTIPAAGGKK